MAGDDRTLAARLRAKHPGAYDDLSDADLESKVRAKYPGVYDDLPSSAPPQDADRPAPDNRAATAAKGLGAVAGATAIAQPVLSKIAESQGLANVIEKVAGAGRLVPGAGTLAGTGASLAYGVAKGEDPTKLAVRGVTGAATSYGAKLFKEALKAGARHLQPAAANVANALGLELGAPVGAGLGLAPEAAAVGTAPLAVPLAGGLGGVTGAMGFLAALQHDANRKVTIDYSKNTPDTAIARVFGDMQRSEANRRRTRDERMDDPSDPMFQADDTATAVPALAREAVIAQLKGR